MIPAASVFWFSQLPGQIVDVLPATRRSQSVLVVGVILLTVGLVLLLGSVVNEAWDSIYLALTWVGSTMARTLRRTDLMCECLKKDMNS